MTTIDGGPSSPDPLRRPVRGRFRRLRDAAVVRLTLAYAAFAAIAIGLNLAVQAWVLGVAGPWAAPRLSAMGLPHGPRVMVFPALIAGTGAGLLLKYGLDKRFIFADGSRGAAQHVKKFSLYALMGVATTGIFWGCELIAAWLHPGGAGVYAGGVFGLVLGYIVKYRLDRKFVFMQASTQAAMHAPASAIVPASAPPPAILGSSASMASTQAPAESS